MIMKKWIHEKCNHIGNTDRLCNKKKRQQPVRVMVVSFMEHQRQGKQNQEDKREKGQILKKLELHDISFFQLLFPGQKKRNNLIEAE